MAGEVEVVRVVAGRLWHALHDDEVVGRAHVLVRADRRAFVAVDAWHEDVADLLLRTVLADVPDALLSVVGEQDSRQRDLLQRHGFGVVRREDEVVLPVAVAHARTRGAAAPPSVVARAAEAVDVGRLAELEAALRSDAPGSDGWVADVDRFRAETFDARWFDPATYRVAVHEPSGELVGLARAWRGRRPRLALVGVVPELRRRGVARWLVGQVVEVLAARGVPLLTAEADAADAAAQGLLRCLGAERTGGVVELRRWAV